MKHKTILTGILLLLMFTLTGELAAIDFNFTSDQSSLRCSGGIVAIGDVDRSVRKQCGDPLAVTRRASDSYDIWIYQFGASKFMYYLGFLNGKLQRIVSAPCSVNDPDCYDLR
jgi:hypothetical protein